MAFFLFNRFFSICITRSSWNSLIIHHRIPHLKTSIDATTSRAPWTIVIEHNLKGVKSYIFPDFHILNKYYISLTTSFKLFIFECCNVLKETKIQEKGEKNPNTISASPKGSNLISWSLFLIFFNAIVFTQVIPY